MVTEEEKPLRYQIVEKLSSEGGAALDLSCNLTSNKQLELFTEEIGFKQLGSSYIVERADMYKRLTCSYQARNREDLKSIGMCPEYVNGNGYKYEDA